MCGIVGIAGAAPVAERLVGALARLEYRGYDSAGIATLAGGDILRCRAQGKLENLAARLSETPLSGTIGIGHTRWATHGAPTEANAHPHATHHLAVVHNGIIENYRDLLTGLAQDGYSPQTQTDTEVVALLVTREMDNGVTAEEAVPRALAQLRGAYALLFLFRGNGRRLIAARRGSPLALGYGEDEMYLGSDAVALTPFTSRISYLEEGDWAVVEPEGATIYDDTGRRVERPVRVLDQSDEIAEKFPYPHFMAKEIHEQPQMVAHTVNQFVDPAAMTLRPMPPLPFDFATLPRITAAACGTAYLAGAVAKYWFEDLARLPFEIDIASEFRYRRPPLADGGLSLFISQSGETADTLAALRHCAGEGQNIAAIVNATHSTIAREAHAFFPLLCGPEIGVASTKAFTSQLAVLAALALVAAEARQTLDPPALRRRIAALTMLPTALIETLRVEPEIVAIAQKLAKARDVLFLGRGVYAPLAFEGALKLKEISYIHAEGYAAGELKHGPIALVDGDTPVVVIAPSDELFEKTLSNMEEVSARGGPVILITDTAGAAHVAGRNVTVVALPGTDPFIAPIVAALPLQLLAYHTALLKGHDIDRPRNLAKSVTVE
ncbi:glutamine--fructose-6-phosphate transaminase (isomerizing) [Pelagibacterium sediminicola]|uniref:glutamine--fructose-6-phosphate transaminase (isomerizing) n=1 Tax=Pelagibacterium sediminicola TaxID=2248761 RepID=UPI000E313FC1|nr:glutamine--fructose-6-phosphate transaminase (isomerizing) [Pelagibacterium sediminicola]